MYEYAAKITKVYDGDTFTFLVDLGFSIYDTERLRLSGVDTPEMRGSERTEGIKVRDYVRSLILNETVTIRVYKKGKYGRYIADVFFTDDNGVTVNLSEHLVAENMAKEVTY